MKRQSFTRPGYDCVAKPCGKNGCGTHRGSGHGIGSIEWHYVVIDNDVAISVAVLSGLYPETAVARGILFEKCSILSMFLHTAFPLDREDVRTGSKGEKCDYVAGGHCFTIDVGCGTRERFEEAFTEAFEQPEAFWTALEGLLQERGHRARAERADHKHNQCSKCGGTGTTPV